MELFISILLAVAALRSSQRCWITYLNRSFLQLAPEESGHYFEKQVFYEECNRADHNDLRAVDWVCARSSASGTPARNCVGEVEFIYLFVYLDNLLLQFAKDITRITANNRAVPNADTGGTKNEPSRAATQGIFGGSSTEQSSVRTNKASFQSKPGNRASFWNTWNRNVGGLVMYGKRILPK